MIALRRQLNRWFGTGPWRLAPFEEIARGRTDETARGVHQAEALAGIVRREEDAGFLYPSRVALLGQPELGEVLPDGPRYRPTGVTAGEPKVLFTLTDAGVAGRDGIVYCPRQRLAAQETVRRWQGPAQDHPILGAVGFPKPQPLAGVSLSLATLDAEGFYHFLLESLPRVWLARELIASVQHVLVSGEHQRGHEAWLARAGLPPEKIVWLGAHAHYRCEQLLFANRPIRNYQPTPWVRDALRRLLRAPECAAPQRWLWISRVGARVRHIEWEDELLARFPRFEKIAWAERSPEEQMALFAGAAVVAGPHGGGLANLVFASPGVRVAEFFPDDRIQPLYARIAQVAGGSAAWATTDFTRPVDFDRLVPALENFLNG